LRSTFPVFRIESRDPSFVWRPPAHI
jgi:hypothetical protein